MSLSAGEIFDMVLYQISAVKGICEALGGRLNHVKPHGALANRAASDPALARALATAFASLSPRLAILAISGSAFEAAARDAGLQTFAEVYADRGYRADGALVPRMVDEFPILALAATQAQGITQVRGAAELRVKETDRIANIVEGLRALGARIEAHPDGFDIEGPTPLRGAEVDPHGDDPVVFSVQLRVGQLFRDFIAVFSLEVIGEKEFSVLLHALQFGQVRTVSLYVPGFGGEEDTFRVPEVRVYSPDGVIFSALVVDHLVDPDVGVEGKTG